MTKYLLSVFGAWPLQKVTTGRIILRTVVVLLVISSLLPQLFRVFTQFNDLDAVIESSAIAFLHLISIINAIYCFSNNEIEKKLLIQIRNLWESRLSEIERGYLEVYGNAGKKITHIYAISLYGTGMITLLTTISPILLDKILPLNETRPTVFLYRAEYFIDEEEYSMFILIHSWIVTPFQVTIIVGFDSLYAHYVQHLCSWYLIVGHRMKNISTALDKINKNNNLFDENKRIILSFEKCINEHIKALEFTSNIQSIYGTPLFFIIGINMVQISMTGCHTISKIGEPQEAVRYGSFAMAQFVHLFFLSWPGQKIIDHSGDLFRSM
ncbi:uncharacterized protein LOC122856194 [Aphidius gifuensis]|uniref:uncharacterized protein LOC122856194 n=1 Tax=Aphidius gifuensis TaxID=684658 RepID=UPI001CDC8A70|nr:uncharacterized protein LOC122856194 [Aphidius gifuensis]